MTSGWTANPDHPALTTRHRPHPAPPAPVSGAEVPEQAVIPGAVGVWPYTVGVEQQALPAGAVVPFGGPSSDRQVCPPVGDAELTEVNVPRPAAIVGQQSVRCAAVAVADDQPINWRD